METFIEKVPFEEAFVDEFELDSMRRECESREKIISVKMDFS